MHLGGGHIAIPGLLEAQSPCRREGRLSGEIRISFDDVMNARPINQVVIDRPGGGAEGNRLGILLAEVERAAPSVIEEDSVTAARSTRGDEEGNTLVHGIRRFLKAVRIAVQKDKRLAATIERTCLVAQTEKMLRLPEYLA